MADGLPALLLARLGEFAAERSEQAARRVRLRRIHSAYPHKRR